MSTERERLKSKIMAQVEVLVEKALAQGEKRLTLSQIEELALAARSEIAQELTSGVWLSSLPPYHQAKQVRPRIGGYTLPATTLWEHTQQVGQSWLTAQQQ